MKSSVSSVSSVSRGVRARGVQSIDAFYNDRFFAQKSNKNEHERK
jgi:hypothetical protein